MRHVDFGHVLAHKLEALSNHDLMHGEAVAIDILFSSFIAKERGLLSAKDFDRILSLHETLGLPFFHPSLTREGLSDGIEESKAHKGGRLMMVVPTAIGKTTFVDNLGGNELTRAMKFLRRKQAAADLAAFKKLEDRPRVLDQLEEYINSLPQDFIHHLSEMEEVFNSVDLNELRLVVRMTAKDYKIEFSEEAARAEKWLKESDKELKLEVLEGGRLLKVRDHFRSYEFQLSEEQLYRVQSPTETSSTDDIAEELLERKTFVFDIDDTVIDNSGGTDSKEKIIREYIIRLLTQGKVVAFATVRPFSIQDSKNQDRLVNTGIPFIEDLLNDSRVKSHMASNILLFSKTSTHRHFFKKDEAGSVTATHDQEYYDK